MKYYRLILFIGLFLSCGGTKNVEKSDEKTVGLSNSQIKSTISKYSKDIKHCYEDISKNYSNFKGNFIIEIIIQKDGLVSSVEVVQSSFSNSSFEKCIISKIENWRFPELYQLKQFIIKYPFSFGKK